MKRQGMLLIVDDEVGFLNNVTEYFRNRGYNVLAAEDAETALKLVERHTVDAALVDVALPGMNGFELFERLKAEDPLVQVVMVTAQATVEKAVEAMRRGAYDYAAKPIRLRTLEETVQRAVEKAILSRQNRAYQEALRRRGVRLVREIIARSPAMRQVLATVEGYSRTDLPVLLEGETGVGKELIAEFIHANSDRRHMPLTVLDCSALSENLLESELFGHEKGAFTGATEARPGMLEIADGGVLLLDEIGDMSLSAQTRLLRFLEKGVFRRVGSRAEKAVDVRVIAATNHDLPADVKAGRFRPDLFHRLYVFHVRIPPLRERREDILPLAEAALAGLRGMPQTLTEAACRELVLYPWPGNVRELLHTMERAASSAFLAGANEIDTRHLGLSVCASTEASDAICSLAEAQARHVANVLRHCGGNRKKAAEILGISERQLYRLIKPGFRA